MFDPKCADFPKLSDNGFRFEAKALSMKLDLKKSIIPSNGNDVCTAVSEEILFIIFFITIKMTMIWRVQVSAAENIFLEHTVKIRVRPVVEAEQALVIINH